MPNNLKIRMLRDSNFDLGSRYIVIDDFNPLNMVYNKGAQIYFSEYRNGRIIKGKADKTAKVRVIGKFDSDVYELPSVEDYRLLSEVLKRSGMIFNKKKGCFMKLNKR